MEDEQRGKLQKYCHRRFFNVTPEMSNGTGTDVGSDHDTGPGEEMAVIVRPVPMATDGGARYIPGGDATARWLKRWIIWRRCRPIHRQHPTQPLFMGVVDVVMLGATLPTGQAACRASTM